MKGNRGVYVVLLLAVMLQSCDSNSLYRMRARYVFSDFDLESVCEDVSNMRVTDCSELVNIPEIECEPKDVSYKDICDSVFIVRLETTEECLIGKASKMFFHNDTIFVKDKYQSLYMFAPDGKYIRQIGSRGQGPGEYAELTDFFVDDSVYIWDNMQNKLSIFNKNGTFLYSKIAPFLSCQFGKLNSQTFIFRAFNNYNLQIPKLDDYCVWTTDTNFVINNCGMYCDYESRIFPYDDNGMCFTGSCVTEYEKYTDSLFVITDDSKLKCQYVLKFDGLHNNAVFKNLTRKEAKNYINTNKDFVHILRCVFNNHFVVLQAFQQGKCDNVFLYSSFSKRTHRINNIDFNNEEYLCPNLYVCSAFYKDFFVQLEDASYVQQLNKLSKYVGGDFNDIKEEDNPVLIFYKFKK